MSTQASSVKLWRQKTKARIVESMGKKCVCCGYSACHAALGFHHLDPNTKEKTIASMLANPVKWESIVEELRKCVLICVRCHAELHAGYIQLPTSLIQFNEDFSDYRPVFPQTYCPVCGKEKQFHNKTCSLECGATIRYNVDWSQVDLDDLINKQHKTYVAIGEMLGISDGAVHKRAKKLGIKKLTL